MCAQEMRIVESFFIVLFVLAAKDLPVTLKASATKVSIARLFAFFKNILKIYIFKLNFFRLRL